MKILHISFSDYIGGASRATLRIHQSLLKSGIDSNFLVLKKSKKNNFKVNQIHHNQQIYFIKIFINKLTNFLFPNKTSILSLNLFSNGIYKYINKSKFNIIHLHWINNETISLSDILRINKKIIWTCHDMWPFIGAYHYSFENNLKSINFIDKFILKKKKFLKKKDIFFIGVSKWIKNSLKNSIFKNSKISYVNNPIDIKFWKPKNIYECRKKLKLKKDKFYIGVGNLEINKFNRKGADLFFQAIKILENNKFNFEIVEFGNKEKIHINNSQIKINSFGMINDDKILRTIYNSLNLLVLPSKIEAFGQVASEAILCGTPVSGFSKTGLDDIVIDKKNGVLAKKFTSTELYRAINFFIKKRDLIKKKVRYTILHKFSYKTISKNYISIYRKILNEKN
jgi:glycosyltransferase involved in cell wall biosynthesis